MFRINSISGISPQARETHALLFFLLALLGLKLDLADSQSYKLALDNVNSPPVVIPTDLRKLVYSVPLNQLTSRPIIAYIQDKTGKTVTSLDGNMKAYVTSMDKSQKKQTDPDNWRDSGGILCQWSNPDVDWPVRYDRELYYTKCGSSLRKTSLIMKVLKGKVIMDWLMHVHPNGTLPTDDRFIRIEIPDLKLVKDTNLFKITEPAASLNITKQPPKNVTANTEFDIRAEILDRNGAPLTVGLDSVACVELTVSYNYKIFHHKGGKDMIVKSAETRLGGRFVTTYHGTRDLVIRKRAVAGKVNFTDVRLLDVSYQLQLNLTMFMSTDPFLRIPNCGKCYSDLSYKTVINDDEVIFKMPPPSVLKNIPSMKFTDMFNVLPQTFAKLKFHQMDFMKGKTRITRNFPIPGPIRIETRDAYGNRIYSGHDSTLPLEVKAIPSGVCLSNDYSAISNEGIATVSGSICNIISSVYLVFYTKKLPTVNATTNEYEVVGDVHIAHFDHFQYTGAGREISPHINSFIRFAAMDINNGIIPGVLRPFNFKLVIDTVETNDNIRHTRQQYTLITRKSKADPSATLRAALLSGNPMVSSAIIGDLVREKTALITLDEKNEQFRDILFFNRVCWSSTQIYRSFFKYCHERHWHHIIFLRTANIDTSREMHRYAREMEIGLEEIIIEDEKVQWEDKDPEKFDAMRRAMKEFKEKKIKVVICYANNTQMPAILRVAKNEGLSSDEGYQWVFVSEHAWAFPFNNSFSCDLFPECTTSFTGSILFTETYNTSFFHTKDWERVLNYYYSVDKSMYIGLKSVYPDTDTGARMALAYDATWLYAKALTNVASKILTATTERITEELRKVSIEGLSGTVQLDSEGDREGFLANIRIINATEPKQPMEKVAPLYRYIKTTPEFENIEYLYEDGRYVHVNNETILKERLPTSDIYNIRAFKSKTGRLSKINLKLIPYANETWPSKYIIRKEYSLPAFSCTHPCGLEPEEEDKNDYDRGACMPMDVCECFTGYFGESCEKLVCKCAYGYCNEPFKCICYDGYTGDSCNIPICPGGCVNGVCSKPNKCKCFKIYWVGRYCEIHLAAILTPIFILLILFNIFGYKLFIFLRIHIERAAALTNVDWLVDWQEVIQIDKSNTAVMNTFKSSIGNMADNLYTWKKRKWYVKKINANTIDYDDKNMRLEMVELISINHQNLITYGGACIVNPNVCFLVEHTQKGSLEDVLMSEMQLGWHFRFSFMKDICRGMNYLHTKTKIGSHGRLKSSNCLLDNRWCIRITDFGATRIRYGPYLIEKSEDEKAEEYYSMQDALLWTAPELLGTASCLDDIQMGTKEGDVYSFGILVSEIATRDVPFAYERGFLSTCSIIDLIINRDDPVLVNELEIWESLGQNSDLVRPYIDPNYLPERKEEQTKFLKMLNDVWGNDPLERISFQTLKSVLDNIFPTKEELMDNLMQLLESYSKNLEEIVVERTDALEAEKTKVDNIVGQMLPKRIIEELKKGNKIEPENFECVTVYYSDIVGFTTIAKSCQPMQVVDLLNDLYILFDNILEEYDVYKVETIGDAYVVSSGVPTLNDNLHASEIASASLDIMSAIMTKETSYLIDVKLQLRLGISTGPVVAGVVGLKMPRYTLFGETMQIAATMESSSKPMHIHISEYTVKILEDLGGFSMKYRSSMTISGKTIDTYWLTGKKGYNKPLPEIIDD